MRHGPHHSAQKSTSTGTFDWIDGLVEVVVTQGLRVFSHRYPSVISGG